MRTLASMAMTYVMTDHNLMSLIYMSNDRIRLEQTQENRLNEMILLAGRPKTYEAIDAARQTLQMIGINT